MSVISTPITKLCTSLPVKSNYPRFCPQLIEYSWHQTSHPPSVSLMQKSSSQKPDTKCSCKGDECCCRAWARRCRIQCWWSRCHRRSGLYVSHQFLGLIEVPRGIERYSKRIFSNLRLPKRPKHLRGVIKELKSSLKSPDQRRSTPFPITQFPLIY